MTESSYSIERAIKIGSTYERLRQGLSRFSTTAADLRKERRPGIRIGPEEREVVQDFFNAVASFRQGLTEEERREILDFDQNLAGQLEIQEKVLLENYSFF